MTARCEAKRAAAPGPGGFGISACRVGRADALTGSEHESEQLKRAPCGAQDGDDAATGRVAQPFPRPQRCVAVT